MAALTFAHNRTSVSDENAKPLEEGTHSAPAVAQSKPRTSGITGEEAAGRSGSATLSSVVPPTAGPSLAINESSLTGASAPLLRAGRKSIDANVGDILDMWVIFHCTGPSGRTSIRLPRDIVPEEVLAYGQPVKITLDSDSGVRFPHIERRIPNTMLDREDPEIDEWFRSL
jgi:hypothetical protein